MPESTSGTPHPNSSPLRWLSDLFRPLIERTPPYTLPAVGLELVFLIALIFAMTTGQPAWITGMLAATFCVIGLAMIKVARDVAMLEARRRTRRRP